MTLGGLFVYFARRAQEEMKKPPNVLQALSLPKHGSQHFHWLCLRVSFPLLCVTMPSHPRNSLLYALTCALIFPEGWFIAPDISAVWFRPQIRTPGFPFRMLILPSHLKDTTTHSSPIASSSFCLFFSHRVCQYDSKIRPYSCILYL